MVYKKSELTPEEKKLAGNKPVGWKPTEKQKQALIRNEFEILYGGARGGAKTEGGLAWLVMDNYHMNEKYRALVLRRNADDLRDWIDRARIFYKMFGGEVVGNPAEVRFKSGAVIRTGHLKDAEAYTKYQGHEYQRILFEELTHITSEDNYEMVIGSCRSTTPELNPQIFATTNPDGPGHKWVKRRWNLAGIPKEITRSYDDRQKFWRCFVPSRVDDNPHLVKNDPRYIDWLSGLPDGLRQQWKDGSWTEFDIKGSVYANEIQQARNENRIKFVPFDPSLKVHTVWDLGVDDSMTIGFFQKYQMGGSSEVRLIAYYENSGFGFPHYASYLEQVQKQRNYRYGKHFAPHDIKVREMSTGQTRKQAAEKVGIKFTDIPKLSIEAGIEATRLMFPRLWITTEYGGEDFLEAVRQHRYAWDEVNQVYKKNPLHDWTSHASDCLKYTAVIEKKFTNENVDHKPYNQAPYKSQSEYEGGAASYRSRKSPNFKQAPYRSESEFEGGKH
mgnify:CR=1 FL=1|jgi:hypothetical protein|tara:strand:- start:978 stop:2480 length:1503 start_codon:yes stop_codon:yes gene_type:complete